MASPPSMEVSIATVGIGWEAATLKRRGRGRALPVFKPGGGDTRSGGRWSDLNGRRAGDSDCTVAAKNRVVVSASSPGYNRVGFGRSGAGVSAVAAAVR
jgi:hypothetical protein